MKKLLLVFMISLILLGGCKIKPTNDDEITFDMFDDYWLVEIVSREPFGDNGYYYQIKVVGTSDYGYQVSNELFSIGELALVIEFEEDKSIMINFNN